MAQVCCHGTLAKGGSGKRGTVEGKARKARRPRYAMVFSAGNPDFNKPVTLQLGADPTAASSQKSVLEMDSFLKKYFGEPPTAPHGPKFKPDPKAFYEHTLVVKFPDLKSKKKVKSKVRSAGKD
uniref:Uncharacterized protein n=1 Tax=Alexandrium andersonii TaxID=327968 RepID=A0A7S2GKQ8_9DINO